MAEIFWQCVSSFSNDLCTTYFATQNFDIQTGKMREMQDIVLSIHKVSLLVVHSAMILIRTQYVIALPDSIERNMLQKGMFAMQRISGPMRGNLDDFVITPVDIIIHYERKLGEGGFARVFEGDWKGSRVAVKELVSGVSHVVRRPCLSSPFL